MGPATAATTFVILTWVTLSGFGYNSDISVALTKPFDFRSSDSASSASESVVLEKESICSENGATQSGISACEASADAESEPPEMVIDFFVAAIMLDGVICLVATVCLGIYVGRRRDAGAPAVERDATATDVVHGAATARSRDVDLFEPVAASKYGKVKASGRIGEIVANDGDKLRYKLKFFDGRNPSADWFCVDALQLPPNVPSTSSGSSAVKERRSSSLGSEGDSVVCSKELSVLRKCVEGLRQGTDSRPQTGDVVRLGGGVPCEHRGSIAIVTKVNEKHCNVIVLDQERRYAAEECWPNFADVTVIESGVSRLGSRVQIHGLTGKKTSHFNSCIGTIVAHPREGHPCFIKKDSAKQPLLVLCVEIDDAPTPDMKTVLLELKYLATVG